MAWISVTERFPTKEKHYHCLCNGFNKPIKCVFRKAKTGPCEWYPDHFRHKGRVPFVMYWRET